MGARKNLRTFKQPDVEEKGRKCSVCGERDVIFFNESENKDKFTRFNKFVIDLTDKNLPKYLTDGEGLCTICFLKRTFEIYLEEVFKKEDNKSVFDNLSFPSTAEVACANWKEKVLDIAKYEFAEYTQKLKEILGERFKQHLTNPVPKLKNKFENLDNLDAQFFHEENISSRYFEKELGIKVEEKTINELKNLLKDICKKAGKPNSYYAIIHLDGDNMGKWLSGELLPKIEHSYNSQIWKKPEDIKINGNTKSFAEKLEELLPKNGGARKLLTPAIHASISTALRNYTLEFVRKIVEEEHLGKLVYAGGDDVLAFVNLKDLFDVMRKLRWAFSGHIKIQNGNVEENFDNNTGFVEKDGRLILTMGANATASMGVVIAHYKTPLQIVIKKVFEMENEAKNFNRGKETKNFNREKETKNIDKDAFAICFMRRSGEERVFKAKWKHESRDTIEILKKLVEYFDDEKEYFIAKSFISKLNSEFIHLKGQGGNFVGNADIFKIQLNRLLRRSFNRKNMMKEEHEKRILNEISDVMEDLFWDTGGNIDNFLNACIIASFLKRVEV